MLPSLGNFYKTDSEVLLKYAGIRCQRNCFTSIWKHVNIKWKIYVGVIFMIFHPSNVSS